MDLDSLITPISGIRGAAATLASGLVDHETINAEQWDEAVATLARVHDQVGGSTRRRLYRAFAAAADARDRAALPSRLSDLASHLNAEQERTPSHALLGVCEP